jgi:hypothetical protein
MDIDFNKLLTATAENKDDNTELRLAYSARVSAMKSYQDRPGKSTKEDLDAANEFYETVSEALWSKYFDKGSSSDWFANKQVAHDYYAKQGGELKYSAFTRKSGLQVMGRKVKAVPVLKMLIAEFQAELAQLRSRKLSGGGEITLSEEREQSETRLAKAKADREEYKRDQELREMSKNWIRREDADLQTCTWVCLLRDTIVGRINKALPELIHQADGSIDRIPDVQAVIDRAVIDACNNIADSGEVDVEIEDVNGEIEESA